MYEKVKETGILDDLELWEGKDVCRWMKESGARERGSERE